MKKFNYFMWIVYVIMFVMTIASASAVSQDDLLDGLVSYWKFDETSGTTADDSHGSYDFTHTDTGLITSGGKIDYGLSFTSNNYHSVNSNPVIPYGAKSISVWVYYVSNSANQYFLVNNGGSGGNNGMSLAVTSSHKLRWEISRSDVIGWNFQFNSATSLSNNAWNHVIVTWDGSTSSNSAKIYINGELDASQTPLDTETASGTNNLLLGRYNPASSDQSMNGRLDELGIWNRALNSTEVSALYDIQKDGYTNGTYNFSALADEPVVSNFSVSVTDEWTGGNVNNISVVVDGETYTNTTGHIVTTHLLENDTNTYLVQVSANNYFSKNYSNVDVSSILEAELYQSIISFDAYEIFTNNSITNFNITIDSTPQTQAGTWYLSAGEYTALIESTGYYAKNHTFNVSALDIKNESINDLYNTIININLTDVITTDLTSVTSYITLNNNDGYEHTYTNTNGSFSINALQDNYSLTMWATNYAFFYDNISVNETTFSNSYLLYANNSLWITAKDIATELDLYNFTVEIYNADNTYTGNDNNTGTARFSNITSGIYTVRVEKETYTIAEYVVTMTGGSYQNLIAYLLQSEYQTIFTAVDSISNSILEGATISMFALISGSWTLISSQETDITGRARFTYTPNIEYRFIVDADDYVQREFFLKPLFATYTIRLTPELESTPDTNTGKWVYEISNKGLFYNALTNNFTISITSGTGTIEYFHLNITDHENITWSVTCSDAIGCAYDRSLNISGADFSDKIIVEFWIKESGRGEKYFRKVYSIQDIYKPNTLWGWRDVSNDDVGGLEKGFFAMIISIIIVGVASSVAVMVGAPPVTVSGLALAGTVEILALVGFIPMLSAHFIAFGCILIVLFGRGNI
jgi:hypothetical protein